MVTDPEILKKKIDALCKIYVSLMANEPESKNPLSWRSDLHMTWRELKDAQAKGTVGLMSAIIHNAEVHLTCFLKLRSSGKLNSIDPLSYGVITGKVIQLGIDCKKTAFAAIAAGIEI